MLIAIGMQNCFYPSVPWKCKYSDKPFWYGIETRFAFHAIDNDIDYVTECRLFEQGANLAPASPCDRELEKACIVPYRRHRI